ncbi:MAG: ArsR family transcriptional regulator [Candidatus Aenigmarchaeota archaeon]|nr:ArsR family transcriptional regulator [Candidatus Aenigmarchaeota archaeon]
MKKRPRLVIRIRILSFLKKRPMNSLELSQRIKCSLKRLEEQLKYLEEKGKIEKIHSKKYNEYFWRLKK